MPPRLEKMTGRTPLIPSWIAGVHETPTQALDAAPTSPFAWWCWLGERHERADVGACLDRSPLLGSLPPVRVVRTAVVDEGFEARSVEPDASYDAVLGKLARWTFRTLVDGALHELPQTAFKGPPPPMLIDEFHLMAGTSKTGKHATASLLAALVPRYSRMLGAPVVSTHTQKLEDYLEGVGGLTDDERRLCEQDVTLDAWLLRHHRIDLLDDLVARSGGWTSSRYQAALDGLEFLQHPRSWSATVQRWAEGARLHLAAQAVMDAANGTTNDRPRRRL